MTNLEIQNAYVGTDQVEKIYLGAEQIYPTTPPVPVSAMPLTFEILSGGTLGWECHSGNTLLPIYVSVNNGAWELMSSGLTLSAGDSVQVKGDNTSYWTYNYANRFTNDSQIKYNVKGNIMALIDSTGYTGLTALTSSNEYAFRFLFSGCTGVVDAANLILPTGLVDGCFWGMFNNCTGLTTAPELPATTLETYCYCNMFAYCTSLRTAPKLPAAVLKTSCYYYMFYECRHISRIECLATDTSASTCIRNWVNGVAATGTFVKNPSMSSWGSGVSGIPSGWTVIDAVI